MGTPELLTDIRERMVKLETLQEANAKAIGDMAGSVNRLVEKLDKSDDIARDADHRARTAHHRIDDVGKSVDEVKGDIKWLWRTVVTSIITGCIGGIITFMWKGIGG